ncbi:metallophosphoesterase [Caloramator sp. mosi_1]|uniref:metallophosphoesterase n=1 Tax=Caloramator sp. mosi_1 TaxID=3023090 RepID=UPI00235F3BFC|nr:metallophosphoesterase [Caloramator sp. mosi_1]WDC85513.1 metallophosphoesterase [Caloramator sp. mosi_1]
MVHTGDIVDNIKLELYPNKLNEYSRYACNFVNELTKYTNKSLFIIPGNHDNIETLKI